MAEENKPEENQTPEQTDSVVNEGQSTGGDADHAREAGSSDNVEPKASSSDGESSVVQERGKSDDPYDVPESASTPVDADSEELNKPVVQESTTGEDGGSQGQGNPKKILDALDQQAKNDANETDESNPQAGSPADDVSSPEDLPLPPGAEEIEVSTGAEAESITDGNEGQASETPQVDPAVSAPQETLDPELMISEAMRKLDKILEEIKEEAETPLSPQDEGDTSKGDNATEENSPKE